jgi:asparagine synthase (glutamine-hydrolysing)
VCVPLYYVSKLARDNGVTVIQVGEGSDELFCGYPWFLNYIREYELDKIMHRVPARLLGGMARTARLGWQLSGRGGQWMDRFERATQRERPFWGGAIVYRGEDKQRLLDTRRWRETTWDSAAIPEKYYRRILELNPGADILEQMIYLELRHRLPELLLMRVDKVCMSTSLEARVPFLDHHLVEFVLPIMMQTKLQGQPKYLLKKAMRGIIPDNIIDRPKRGFPAPVEQWFQSIPHSCLRHALLESNLAQQGYFNLDFVRGMLTEQFDGKRDWAVKLWVLYNLNVWYEHWI